LNAYNPKGNAAASVSGYQLLLTYPYPVLISTFSIMFEAQAGDTAHGCNKIVAFNNSLAAGGTMVQSFPVPLPTAYVLQTFTFTTPFVSSTLMLEMFPAGANQVVCSNLTVA
jgi:hypothetical protein